MRAWWFKGLLASISLGILSATAVAALSVPMRQVELRVTDHKLGIADFKSLSVRLAKISIHTKGATRKEGWLDLLNRSAPVDIVPLKDGKFEKLGMSVIPARRYDALRVKFAELNGELHSGSAPMLLSRDTTVATRLDLRKAGRATILVDLFAENQSDHAPNRYIIKVKAVRISR